ncbi:MAG TPA: hypothetical protein VF484_01855 [Candidatus Limnocylindrales bacterium]
MTDSKPPVTRLPTDDGRGTDHVGSWTWAYRSTDDRGPQLPWIGIFLVIFGALLLLDRAFPGYQVGGSVLVLAAGLAFLVVWGLRRGTFALYAGAFLTAAAVPGIAASLGYDPGQGVGTVSYGVAFLFVAVVRAARGGGWGWQALFGLVLLAIGIPELALPNIADYVLPALLVVLGVLLLARGGSRR